jgi:hypothetical protein
LNPIDFNEFSEYLKIDTVDGRAFWASRAAGRTLFPCPLLPDDEREDKLAGMIFMPDPFRCCAIARTTNSGWVTHEDHLVEFCANSRVTRTKAQTVIAVDSRIMFVSWQNQFSDRWNVIGPRDAPGPPRNRFCGRRMALTQHMEKSPFGAHHPIDPSEWGISPSLR